MGQEAVHRVAAPDAANHIAAMEDAGWVLTSRNDDGSTIVFRWRHDPGEAAKDAPPSLDATHQKRLDDARGMTAPEGVLQIERRLGKTAGDRHIVSSTSSNIWDHVPRSAERSSGSWMSKSVDFAWDDGRIEEGAVGSTHARVVEARDIAPHRSISISELPIAGRYSGSVTEHRAPGPAVHEIREGESVATAFRRLAGDPPQWIVTREQYGEEGSDGSWKHTEHGVIYRVFEGPPQRTPGEEQVARQKREQLLFNNPLTRAGIGVFGCLSSIAFFVLILLGIGLFIAALAGADVWVPLLLVVAAFLGLRFAEHRLRKSRAWTGV